MLKFGVCLLVFLSVMYLTKCDPIPINRDELYTEAMAKMESSFKHYSKDLDSSFSWKQLQSQLASINLKYDFYTTSATNLLKAIREKVSSGTQKYFDSSSLMFEWATFASSSLSIYLEIIDSDHYNGTDMILDVLERGINKMNETIPLLQGVQKDFFDASNSFQSLAQEFNVTKMNMEDGYLRKALNTRLGGYAGATVSSVLFGLLVTGLASGFCEHCETDLKAGLGLGAGVIGLGVSTATIEGKFIPDNDAVIAGIRKYYDSTSKTMKDASQTIDKTIVEIRSEINRLHALKAEAELTQTFILKDFLVVAIKRSAKNLIDACNKYIEFHK